MLLYSKLLSLACLGSCVLAAPSHAHGHRNDASLMDLARAAGKLYFGTAANIPGPETSDKYYMGHFNDSKIFGQATPANYMKWQFAEPARNTFDFSGGDYFVKLAKENGYLVRCHNLVWDQELPSWVSNGNWTKKEMLQIVRNRVKTTVAHYGDACYCWDVVNEALNDDGTYQQNVFYQAAGPEYIAAAFGAAEQTIKQHGLKVKLYYNDYNIEFPGVKATAAQQNIVQYLQDKKIQIDGVGLESHFIVGSTPSVEAQMQSMAEFAALGVEVAVTELDIRTTLPVSEAAGLQQVKDFNTTVSACANTEQCVGVTLWDFDDTYSWVESTYPGWGSADPWYQPGGADTPLKKKAAYQGIVTGFQSGLKPA